MDTLHHILEKHYDLVEYLGVSGLSELAAMLRGMLCGPDEIHVDRFRRDIVYCLKKRSSYWVNVVV